LLAARTILNMLKTGDFFGANGRIMRLRTRFLAGLEQIGARHPGWISGRLAGSDDRVYTVCRDEPTVKRFLTTLFDLGVVAFIAGSSPYRTRFLMP